MRSHVPPIPHNPKVGAAVVAGVITIAASRTPAGATELALPPEEFLSVYRSAAAEADCIIDWALLGGIAGVASNHTITADSKPIPDQAPQTGEPEAETTINSTPAEPAAPQIVPVSVAGVSTTDPGPGQPADEATRPGSAFDVGEDPEANQDADTTAPIVDSDAIAAALAAAFPPPPSTPVVFGPVLDGQNGVHLIPDTDQGTLDHQTVWDRAVGPFQFIPQTWNAYATDGNADGVANPQDLEDAAASAANLLCAVGVNEDPERAVTTYYGTDINNHRVFEHASELRTQWAALQPPPPATQLAEIGPGPETAAQVQTVNANGIVVDASIADAVHAMIAAAKADGIELRGWGWRSHERQIELRAAHCADVWLTPSNQCSPPTARPGHSQHELGLAIDFFTGDDQHTIGPTDPHHSWLVANAATYGFQQLPTETWHWSTTGH